MENLANLGTVPPVGAVTVLGAPRHLNASGGPVRAMAVEIG
jgi:kynurenine formamidase